MDALLLWVHRRCHATTLIVSLAPQRRMFWLHSGLRPACQGVHVEGENATCRKLLRAWGENATCPRHRHGGEGEKIFNRRPRRVDFPSMEPEHECSPAHLQLPDTSHAQLPLPLQPHPLRCLHERYCPSTTASTQRLVPHRSAPSPFRRICAGRTAKAAARNRTNADRCSRIIAHSIENVKKLRHVSECRS